MYEECKMNCMLYYFLILGYISVKVLSDKKVNLQLETVVEFDPNEEEEDLKLIGNLENILKSVRKSMTKRPIYMKNDARTNHSELRNIIPENYNSNLTNPVMINVVKNQRDSMIDKQTIDTVDSILKKDENTISNKHLENDTVGTWRQRVYEDKWKPNLKHIAKLVHALDDNDLQTLVDTVDDEVRRKISRAEDLEINQSMIKGLDYLKSIPKSVIREFLKKNAEDAKRQRPESAYKNSHLFKELSTIFKRINSVFHFIDVPAERKDVDLYEEPKTPEPPPFIGSNSEEKLFVEPSHSQEVKNHKKYFKDVVRNAIKGILKGGMYSNTNDKQRKDIKAKLKRLWQNLNKNHETLNEKVEKKNLMKEKSENDKNMWLKLFQHPEYSRNSREYNIQHSIYNNIGSIQGLSDPRYPARQDIVEIEDYIDEIRHTRSTPKIKHYHINGYNNQLAIKHSDEVPILNEIKLIRDTHKKDVKVNKDKNLFVLLQDYKNNNKMEVTIPKHQQNKKRERKNKKNSSNKPIKQQIQELKTTKTKHKVNKTKVVNKKRPLTKIVYQEKKKKRKGKPFNMKVKNVNKNEKSKKNKKVEHPATRSKTKITLTTTKELQDSPATVDFYRPGHHVKHGATISVIKRPKGKYLSYWTPQNGTWVRKVKSVPSEESVSSSELNFKTEDHTNEGMSIELSNFQKELIKLLQNENEDPTAQVNNAGRRQQPTRTPKYPAYEKLIGQYEYTTGHDSLRRKALDSNKTITDNRNSNLSPQIVQRIDYLEKKFKNFENFIKDINSSSTETQKNHEMRAWGFNKCPLISTKASSQAIIKRATSDTKPTTTVKTTLPPTTITVTKTTKTAKVLKKETDNEITSEVTTIASLTQESLNIDRRFDSATKSTLPTKNITTGNIGDGKTLTPEIAAVTEDSKLKINATEMPYFWKIVSLRVNEIFGKSK